MNTPTIIDQKNAWHAIDLKNDNRWLYQLNDQDIEAMINALNLVKKLKLNLSEIDAQNFLLDALQPLFTKILNELISGYGVTLVKNFPVPNENLTVEDIRMLYWGFCQHIGKPIIQNRQKDVLYDIRDTGVSLQEKNARGPQTRDALALHTDPGDILGMCCINPAAYGGISTLASVATIHNEIVKLRPDLAEVLYQPFYSDRRNHELPGDLPYSSNPVFSVKNENLLCQYVRLYINDAQKKFADVNRLSDKQIEALNLFDTIAHRQDVMLEIKLEKGNMLFLNNNKVLHGRAAYGDEGKLTDKRHLLRIWLYRSDITSMSNLFGYADPVL